jgi:hypothetical protein
MISFSIGKNPVSSDFHTITARNFHGLERKDKRMNNDVEAKEGGIGTDAVFGMDRAWRLSTQTAVDTVAGTTHTVEKSPIRIQNQ